MKTNDLLLIGAALFGGWYFFMRKPDKAGQLSYLTNWINSLPDTSGQKAVLLAKITVQMSDAEVETVYEYIHDYVTKNRNLVEGSDLYNRIMAVSNKYEIFT